MTPDSGEGRGDRNESLDFAERWIADGFRVIELPGGAMGVDLEMTHARALLERLRARGVPVTYNHVVVRAAALALERHPELHVLVAGTRRLRPERVDIGLSVSGETTFAPVMVIEDAGRKPLPVLSEEIVRRTPEVRAKDAVDLARTRRWGWLVPFGFLRRALLRALFNRTWFRRRLTGTFQVTCVSPADWSVPITFNTCACLAVGRVRDRVVAVDGRPAVRPMVTLVVTVDHNAWDGARALVFFEEMRRVLESDALDAEVGDAADAGPGLSPREPRGR